MKQFILVVLLIFGWALFTGPAAAHSHSTPVVVKRFNSNAPCVYEKDHAWKHWGAAPYGPALKDTLSDAKLSWYLKCSQVIPHSLDDQIRAAVRANPEGTVMYLTPDMVLPEMGSAADAQHPTQFIMSNVPVAKLIVKYGVAWAAEARYWDVTDADGTTIRFIVAIICGNPTALVMRSAPPPPTCATVDVTVPAGNSRSVRFTTVRHQPIDSFGCWGAIEGKHRTGSPHNCDSCHWGQMAIYDMESWFGGRYHLFHASKYDLQNTGPEEVVTLVLPLAARDGGIAVCVEVDGNRYQAYLIPPNFWQGKDTFKIPPDYFGGPPKQVDNPF